jgi:hypothetical protein
MIVDGSHAVVASWPVADGVAVTTRELVDLARTNDAWRCALLAWCRLRLLSELPSPRSVGNILRVMRGQVLGGHVLEVVKRAGAGAVWVRLRADTPEASTS